MNEEGFVSLVEPTTPTQVVAVGGFDASCVCYDCVTCDELPCDDECQTER
jgi:hypothetical protein